MSDVLATLKIVRATYPTPMSTAQLGALLNEVAWRHRHEGVGLERKGGGFTAIQPRTDIAIASDILRFPGNIGRDVLGDADGLAIPAWGDPGPADPATFVAPVEPVSVVPVEVPPDTPPAHVPPPAPPVDLAPLWAAIKELQADVARLKAVKPPTYRVTGSTSRDYGHSHRINVTLEPQP